MDTTTLFTIETSQTNDNMPLNQLSDLQLALVGGGSADVILA